MLQYSPYNNIRNDSVKYPNILLTSGLNDPRVQYFEPTKFVALLRHNDAKKPSENRSLFLLRTNMSAGHGGSAARYAQMREVSQDLAFIVSQVGY